MDDIGSPCRDHSLDPIEGLLGNYRGQGSLDPDRIGASLIPDDDAGIDLVSEYIENSILIPRFSGIRQEPEPIQFYRDFLGAMPVARKRKDHTDSGRCLLVDDQFPSHPLTVGNVFHFQPKGSGASVDESAESVLLHASSCVLADSLRLTFIPRLDDRFHECALGALADRFGCGDNQNAAIAKLSFEHERIEAISRKSRELPDKNDIKGAGLRIREHSIEILAIRVPAGFTFVDVLEFLACDP